MGDHKQEKKKYITEEDEKAYGNIYMRYKKLSEVDGAGAFKLMKDAMAVYNRFSYIRYQIRKDASRGQYAALKERLHDMCKFLEEVHTDTRVILKICREDMKKDGD